MKFLLDHDVPIDISYCLTELGHKVVLLPQVLDTSAHDEQVLSYASSKGWVLISCNRDDFLKLAETKTHAGVIVLIRRRTRAAERAALIGCSTRQAS
jgi:predicted nuclease of predicted toxin-antitoxin system